MANPNGKSEEISVEVCYRHGNPEPGCCKKCHRCGNNIFDRYYQKHIANCRQAEGKPYADPLDAPVVRSQPDYGDL